MTDEEKPSSGARRGRRIPRRITEERLANIALHYLERFAASSDRLRQVLRRRVRKAALHHETDMDAAFRWIEGLIARYERSGLLDDASFARARAESDWRAGRPMRAIRHRLQAQGVGETEIEGALAHLADEAGQNPDRQAALSYARRRRLGPYRPAAERESRRERDLAAMARAGFGYDLAKRVIEADDPEELEEDLR